VKTEKVLKKGHDQWIKKHGTKTMKESSEKKLNVIKFEKNKTTFILCDCRSEVLVLEHDIEYGLTELSIYENMSSYGHKMSLWQKLRYIYQVLVHNRPYSDQIILNQDQLKDLGMFINGCI
jgi:transglutaminase/protease-like cytokinesis protein 3